MLSSTEINDKFKLSTDVSLLKRLIAHGYALAFNSAASDEEEEFLFIRKDRSIDALKQELKQLKTLLS